MQTLYFAYAVYGFTFAFISLSVQFQMVNTYNFTSSDLAFAWSCVSLPWAFKPFYGYISDKTGRRVSVCVGAFMSALTLAYLPNFGEHIVYGMALSSLCICYADVASDSIVVTYTKTRGKALQSTCWTARSFGSMIGTGLSGMAYEYLGYNTVLRVSAVGPFILSLMIWNIREPQDVMVAAGRIEERFSQNLGTSHSISYPYGCSYYAPKWIDKGGFNSLQTSPKKCGDSSGSLRSVQYTFTCVCVAQLPVCPQGVVSAVTSYASDGSVQSTSSECVCGSTTCNNNQTCTVTGATGTCTCPPGFTGTNCETCDTGYYGDSCVPYSCTCSNGSPATGAECTTNGDMCTSCNSGYYLNGTACLVHTPCGPGFGVPEGLVDNLPVDTAFSCEACVGTNHEFSNLTDYSSCAQHTICPAGYEPDRSKDGESNPGCVFSELLPKDSLFFFHTETGNPHFPAARVDLDAPQRRSVVCDRRVAGRGADERALRVVHLGAALPRKVVETSWGW